MMADRALHVELLGLTANEEAECASALLAAQVTVASGAHPALAAVAGAAHSSAPNALWRIWLEPSGASRPPQWADVTLAYGPERAERLSRVLSALARAAKAEESTREALEREHRRDKLEAIALLVSGITHELNNPISVLYGLSTLLLEDAANSGLHDDLTAMSDASIRCDAVLQGLLRFSRLHGVEMADVCLPDVVALALEAGAAQAEMAGVTLSSSITASQGIVRGSAELLSEMVSALVDNAIAAAARAEGSKTVSVEVTAEDAWVVLEVHNTGAPIPYDTQRRLFDPFFTTAPAGGGTGLGLSHCYGIVIEHQGDIDVASRPGHGTRFTVRLPLAE
jgi:signal transduction histidine kinase